MAWRQVYRSIRPNEIMWKASFANSLVGYATVQNDEPTNLQQRVVKTFCLSGQGLGRDNRWEFRNKRRWQKLGTIKPRAEGQ
jgi:hypothetical protein